MEKGQTVSISCQHLKRLARTLEIFFKWNSYKWAPNSVAKVTRYAIVLGSERGTLYLAMQTAWERGKPATWPKLQNAKQKEQKKTMLSVITLSYRRTYAWTVMVGQMLKLWTIGWEPTRRAGIQLVIIIIINNNHTPIAIESLGACGPLTLEFLRDLGNRIRQATGEESSFMYLLQRLSVAVQRGNAASVLGTSAHCSPPD